MNHVPFTPYTEYHCCGIRLLVEDSRVFYEERNYPSLQRGHGYPDWPYPAEFYLVKCEECGETTMIERNDRCVQEEWMSISPDCAAEVVQKVHSYALAQLAIQAEWAAKRGRWMEEVTEPDFDAEATAAYVNQDR